MACHREFRSLARDVIVVAVIAVFTVQALRRWCGDRYLVDSDSMQPALYGDPSNGDSVFVDKLASAADRRRHDLVVVVHPDKPGQQLVKRIVARGDDVPAGCWVDIQKGDIWLGDDLQSMQRETKDPLAARSVRVPWAAWPAPESKASAKAPHLDLSAARGELGELQLPALDASADEARVLFRSGRVVPTGFLGTARSVDASYLDLRGDRGAVGEDVGVFDCGMECEVLSPVDAILGSIDSIAEVLTFHWQPATGHVALWRDGDTVDSKDLGVRATGAHRIEFGRLDDRFYFVVDGRRDALFIVGRQASWRARQASRRGKGPGSHVSLGALGKGVLRIASVLVFHDVFAYRDPIAGLPGEQGEWPRFVGPGEWFLLGDNPFDSRDSRQFKAVPSTSFLGAPRLVVGPWPRCRWLGP